MFKKKLVGKKRIGKSHTRKAIVKVLSTISSGSIGLCHGQVIKTKLYLRC